jgi:hypothetical protein
VLKLDLMGEGRDALEKSVYYLGQMGAFTSAGMLALKAKQFDDGLYAAVEGAATRGQGRLPGKLKLLGGLLAALAREDLKAQDGSLQAAAIVLAAARLGNLRPETASSAALKQAAEAERKEFLADGKRSKPLGFYTWSQELVQVFQRDRILQSALGDKALVVARALAREPGLFDAYGAHLRLAERLTNPLAAEDLRGAVAQLRARRAPKLARTAAIAPASASHEGELIKKLYGNRPIPAGFSLIDELIKRIRSGALSLKPGPASGWYDHQTWALEPLLIPEKMPEGQHLKLTDAYKEYLTELFKALLAATRETHVKQVESPAAGGGPPELVIGPGLTVEPLASYYLRRAESYRFVRGVLEEALGKGELGKLKRVTPAGPSNMTLDEELTLVQQLFHGAYLSSCDHLGLAPRADKHLGQASDRDVLTAWAASPGRDPDMFQDVRVMVPVFYDLQRRKMKVWAILGLRKRVLKAEFATRPAVTSVKRGDGKPAAAKDLHITWSDQESPVVELVASEVYVSQLLDRAEFRKHCDRHKTVKAILANLR